MTDARVILDAYAVEETLGGYDCETARVEFAPKAFAALRAVLELHQPSRISEQGPRHWTWCITCQTSSRALWPCETYQAVIAALVAEPAPVEHTARPGHRRSCQHDDVAPGTICPGCAEIDAAFAAAHAHAAAAHAHAAAVNPPRPERGTEPSTKE